MRRAAAASRAPASTKPSGERQASQTPLQSVSKSPSAVPSTSDGQDAATSTPAETQSTEPKESETSHEPTSSKEPGTLVPEKETDRSSETAIPIPAPKPKTHTPITPSALANPRPPRPAPAPAPAPAHTESSVGKTAPSASNSSQKSPSTGNKRPVPDPKPTPIQPARKTPDVTHSAEQATSASVPGDSTQIRPTKRRKTSELATPASNNDVTVPPNPPGTSATQANANVVAEGGSQQKSKAATKTARKPTKPRKKQTAAEAAAMVVEGVVGEKKPRGRRRRASTPENAESVEITPTVVKMSDLCRDLQTGKKSKREIELRNMDRAEAERKRNGSKKENRDSVSKENTEDALAKADEERDLAEADSQAGPQMRIVNGEIVLDSSSLQIDRHANAARNADDMEEVEENPLTRRINAASYGKRSKTESWDEEMTDLFYRGLRTFGTDFMMISKMFPSRTRRQIKLKFSNEERKHPERIKETLLGPRESITLETYSEMTNTVYDDPKIIQQELDDEKKRIEEEHAREKEAQEDLLHNPDRNRANEDASGNVLPSIENGSNAVAKKPRKKSAQNKKYGGGTEEVLGSIDDGG